MAKGKSRSAQMSRIRAKNTAPERALRRALTDRCHRYRLQHKTPAGRADLAFPGKKVAVFIDGCFWHGCPDHYVRPRSRADFWAAKLTENVERDRRQTLKAEAEGWRVVRVWEHAVFTELEAVVFQIESALWDARWEPSEGWRVVKVEPLDEVGEQERRHQEPLRGGGETRIVEQARHTRKWKVGKGIGGDLEEDVDEELELGGIKPQSMSPESPAPAPMWPQSRTGEPTTSSSQ